MLVILQMISRFAVSDIHRSVLRSHPHREGTKVDFFDEARGSNLHGIKMPALGARDCLFTNFFQVLPFVQHPPVKSIRYKGGGVPELRNFVPKHALPRYCW